MPAVLRSPYIIRKSALSHCPGHHGDLACLEGVGKEMRYHSNYDNAEQHADGKTDQTFICQLIHQNEAAHSQKTDTDQCTGVKEEAMKGKG